MRSEEALLPSGVPSEVEGRIVEFGIRRETRNRKTETGKKKANGGKEEKECDFLRWFEDAFAKVIL